MYESDRITPTFPKDKKYCDCEDCVGTGYYYGDRDDEDDNGEVRTYKCERCCGSGQLEIEED